MPAQSDNLRRISDERIAFLKAESDRFANALNAVSDQLRSKSIDLLSNLTQSNAANARAVVTLQRELQGQLNALDYDGKVRDFIGQYDASITFAVQTLDALDIPVTKLAPLDAKALQALKAHDYTFLTGAGEDTIQAVATGVVQNTLMGTPRSQIIDNISSTLSVRLKGQAATYADTALVSYDRRTAMATWSAAGLTAFLYRGPKDIKNRPFCDHYVGQVFTLDQIKALDKELEKYSKRPLLPAMIYGGGWSCRHVFTPVANGEAEAPGERLPEGATHEQRLAFAEIPADLVLKTYDAAGKFIGYRVSGKDQVYASGGAAAKLAKKTLHEARPDLKKAHDERVGGDGPRPEPRPASSVKLPSKAPAVIAPPTVPLGPGGEEFIPGPQIRKRLKLAIAELETTRQAILAQRAKLFEDLEQAVGIVPRGLIRSKLSDLAKEADGLYERIEAGGAKELLYAKLPAAVTHKVISQYSPRQELVIQKGVDAFSSLVGRGHAVDGRTIYVKNDPAKQRSFYDVNAPGETMISSYAGADVVVHELGHWYEDFDEFGRAKIREFLKRRTTRPDGTRESMVQLRTLRKNSNYDYTEITRPAKFKEPYTGKVYTSEDRRLRGIDAEKVYATEVMSMGLQQMHNNAAKFAREDADFFDTIWSILRAPR